MFFVDSNIFLQFLLADHPKQSLACKELFKKAVQGQIHLFTLPLVIAEISWVLSSFYKEPAKEVARKLRIILLCENLEIPHKNALLLATKIFETKKIDFIDAYISAWLKTKKVNKIYSYDKDFDKVEEIKRIEP